MDRERHIIHVDMDAFFAAVEQRDNPELRGRPVIVGGDPEGRGVVSTASYEARKFGVRSAMPLSQAKKLCPHGIFIRANMKKYVEVSREIREIFGRYTPLVEPLSLDEAFLDVTGSTGLFGSAVEIGRKIKREIREQTGLVASVGIAPNKFLAKLASDMDKPDGFFVITSEKVPEILANLPVERMYGVGKKTAQKLRDLGLLTVGQVARVDRDFLTYHFGAFGERLYELSRGIDHTPVVPERPTKSVGHETTFPEDISDRDFLRQTILELSTRVARRLRQAGVLGQTVTLKIRFSDFKTITRSRSRNEPTNLDREIYREAVLLFDNLNINRPVRLLGVAVSSLVSKDQPRQLKLFENNRERDERLAQAMDRIRDRFGENSITWARLKIDRKKG